MKNEKSSDPDTDSLLGRIVGDVILFAVCCYLVKLGVCYIVSIRVPLIIIGVIVGISAISLRIYKWRNDHDNY